MQARRLCVQAPSGKAVRTFDSFVWFVMHFSATPSLAGAAVPASRFTARAAARTACLRPSVLTAALMALSVGVAPGAVWAQQVAALSEVMVTATRTAQPLTDVLADVSLIDRDTLSQAGFNSLGDVLSRLPGVEFTRNGGPAATTSLLLRGAETRHTLLMIDGVRVDSQSTGGAAWQAIPVAQIERVEVLRGPAAAIYGSDAIGGVVQVFTAQGDGAPNPTVGVGCGQPRHACVAGGHWWQQWRVGLLSPTGTRNQYRLQFPAHGQPRQRRLPPNHGHGAPGFPGQQRPQAASHLAEQRD
jgi:hypothetical protein